VATDVGDGVWVSVEVEVGVSVGISVKVDVGVAVPVDNGELVWVGLAIWVGVRVGVLVGVENDAGKTVTTYVKPGSPLASSRIPGGTSSLRASIRVAAEPGIKSAPTRTRSPLTSKIPPALHGGIWAFVSEHGTGAIAKFPGKAWSSWKNVTATIVMLEAASATVKATTTGIWVLPPSGGCSVPGTRNGTAGTSMSPASLLPGKISTDLGLLR